MDTLDRYPIHNTFREYLANADDTGGTSKINWLLDERTHAHEKLLTTQLKPFQGPALLVHNDGGKSHRISRAFMYFTNLESSRSILFG